MPDGSQHSSCHRCAGTWWICEEHPDRPWPHDDCAGPAMRCPACARIEPPQLPADWDSFIRAIAPQRNERSLTADPAPAFYTPGLKVPPRKPTPGETLWTIRVRHVTWSCELRVHGEWGVEAQLLRDGDLVIGRRFDTKALAVHWAELERADLEKGARDDEH